MLAQKHVALKLKWFFLTAVIIIIVIKLHFVHFFNISENRRAKRTTKKCRLLTESRRLVALEPKGRMVVQIFDLGQNTGEKLEKTITKKCKFHLTCERMNEFLLRTITYISTNQRWKQKQSSCFLLIDLLDLSYLLIEKSHFVFPKIQRGMIHPFPPLPLYLSL